jgi:acetyltransferase-like isoleucine patch superfamily enzyme
MNMHERIMAGKLFTDMCEGMPEERSEAKKRMIAFNATTPDSIDERMRIQKEMLHEDSGESWIEPPFYFCYGRHIILGEGTYVNFNCNFVDDGMITVGKNVLFGPAVTIATVGHPIRPDMREYMYTDPVTIGDNVWIGENVTICPGVTIGENSVIGAGSVVVKDIPANVIAVGNPCRVLREIGEKDQEYYYRDRKIDPEDLKEEAELRKG